MDQDLSFSRSRRYGTRRISSLWQKWNQLREAIRSLDPIQIQAAFDDCEPWIDWTFWRSSEQALPTSDELLSVATDEEAAVIRACTDRLKSRSTGSSAHHTTLNHTGGIPHDREPARSA